MSKSLLTALCLLPCLPCLAVAAAPEDFPIVPEDISVALFAREPLVRNPCAMAFDALGRLCVGMGPQYRNPKPETPGDSVWIIIDENRDGVADRRVAFATGFNAIQSLAWRGRDLYVANSPDLTIVRDLDGDDVADEYVRLYTDLGNLEHGLHGLSFGPDGKLYMSKGNSKGLNQPPDRVAPKPFRELWGLTAPEGTPDFPPPVTFKKGAYQHNYHDPRDDWGLSGGVLRCDPDGSNLEIVSRGLRNPWDIAFDDGFDWLGTDNDQTGGDKFVAPFYGANFGWGHPWSFSWTDNQHLPSAPSAGPFFEGSGTGVVFSNLSQYPEKYRDVFFVNDWLRREVYIYRPKWQGAWLRPASESFELLAHADRGRSMQSSAGRAFDPVDIELGPDGAIWIASWGRAYGATMESGEMRNEGRIYRFWPKAVQPALSPDDKRREPLAKWTAAQLLEDLGSQVGVWRIGARDELVRRGEAMRQDLEKAMREGPSKAHATWAAWTLGALSLQDEKADAPIIEWAKDSNLNLRLQALRILAFRAKTRGATSLPEVVRAALTDGEPRIRHEAVLAVHRANERRWNQDLLALAARETDRIVFYSTWQALRALVPAGERKPWLTDSRPGVRRAALLSLLEEDALTEDEIRSLEKDADSATAALAKQRLAGKAQVIIRGPKLSGSPATKSPGATLNLLHPGPTATTAEMVLPLLAKADRQRGRDLFLSPWGAGCTACHRLEGVGQVFAPDLADFGRRADAAFAIRSILEPSADITEGFAMQSLALKNGDAYAGIILEETGRGLKLAMAGGVVVEVPVPDIAKREALKISAMPASFAQALGPQDVADLVAYLLQPPTPADKSFQLTDKGDRLEISLQGQPIASYYYRHEQTKRPFFAHLRTPSGLQITRNFPPQEGDAADHPDMHPGVWLAFGKLNGLSFWHNKEGAVVHEAFTTPPAVGPRVAFAVRNRYEAADGRVIARENTSYTITANADGWLLTLDARFTCDQPLTFGVKEEMGLGIRLATPLTVKQGHGAILNSAGGQNEKGTWGKVDSWWDYFGELNGRAVGLQAMSGPGNPAVWSHSRDYGLLVMNPFPVDSKENRLKTTVIQPGQELRLRFGVQIHEHAQREDYQPQTSFDRYLKAAR